MKKSLSQSLQKALVVSIVAIQASLPSSLCRSRQDNTSISIVDTQIVQTTAN